jgi:hypothetical protein
LVAALARQICRLRCGLTRKWRLVAGLLLVTKATAPICARARVLDLGDGSHHAYEEEAERGLGVETGVSDRDNPHTAGLSRDRCFRRFG